MGVCERLGTNYSQRVRGAGQGTDLQHQVQVSLVLKGAVELDYEREAQRGEDVLLGHHVLQLQRPATPMRGGRGDASGDVLHSMWGGMPRTLMRMGPVLL